MAIPQWILDQVFQGQGIGMPKLYKEENPNNKVFGAPPIKAGYQGPDETMKMRQAMEQAGMLGQGDNVFTNPASLDAFRAAPEPAYTKSTRYGADGNLVAGAPGIQDWVQKNIVGQQIDPGSLASSYFTNKQKNPVQDAVATVFGGGDGDKPVDPVLPQNQLTGDLYKDQFGVTTGVKQEPVKTDVGYWGVAGANPAEAVSKVFGKRDGMDDGTGVFGMDLNKNAIPPGLSDLYPWLLKMWENDKKMYGGR